MKFAKSCATLMIAGLLPFAAASEPAGAEVFDWSLTGPAPGKGGVPFPGSGTITATLTSRPGVWDIDTIAGTVNGSEVTGTSTFQSADNQLFTNGFAFVSTTGISFKTAAGQMVNIFSFFGQSTPPTGNAYGELSSDPTAFGVGTFTLTAVPEPATWAMMLIGFAGLGVAGYRASQKRAAAA
jgi:PEP-CTERM motif